jgi:hypothetical protein
MDRVLAVSRTAGYESHSGTRAAGPSYRAVGGGRHVANDFKVLQSGSREEFSALLDGLRADEGRRLELLDAFSAMEPTAMDKLVNVFTGRIVDKLDCGGQWAMFLAGFMAVSEFEDPRHEPAVCVLLGKVNALNSDPVRVRIRGEAKTERLRREGEAETERLRREGEAETERVRREGLAEVERVRQEEEEATEHRRVEAEQRRLADDAETERLRREGLEELELLRHGEPVDWRKVASRIPLVGWFFRKSESAPAGQDQANLADVNQGHVNFS